MIARVAAVLLAAALAACVPSRAQTLGPVERDVEQRVGVRPAWRDSDARTAAAVRDLLARPLDRDAAVRIALVHSRRLRADLELLDVAAADVAAATVLPPTEVEIEAHGAFYGTPETELTVVQDVIDLFAIGRRRGIAGAGIEAARARAVAATVELVAEVETAFHDAVAAQQLLALRQDAFDAAAAAAELAERTFAAGNTTALDLARQRDQREQARLDLGRAQSSVELARERVNEVLGLTGDDTRWRTVESLDDAPADAPALDTLERDAVAASLALAAHAADARGAAGRVGLSGLRAWLPVLGVGVAIGTHDGDWNVGPAVVLGLPIFDQQQGPRARARAELRRARHLTTATAITLRARARAARLHVLEAHAEARHLATVILPLRRQILEETLLHYNAMDATTFELLVARRELADAGRQYIDALRRYHNATAAARALARGGMPGMTGAAPADAPAAAPAAGDAH